LDYGAIFNTTDGGATWNQLPTNYFLKSVGFASGNSGWVVGQYGSIFKTTNAGNSWNKQTTNISDSLQYDDHFYDFASI
jgi:photosystem II stability/assembly factor-like uncharacterized protein